MNNKIEDKATEVKDTTVNAATQVKDALFDNWVLLVEGESDCDVLADTERGIICSG